ncbi:hypothetical protein LU293_03980 [Moraxella nasovis]|uniref:hypothetical protein n=1 Tax=Moraxella nasovis TaxID=2904121 RepID=UPI001F61EEF3|nr:hypothetical protein [Moraxella nasovis]UNU74060.1 hypothetical protein LU293_03980 [Moraxella nasovis]
MKIPPSLYKTIADYQETNLQSALRQNAKLIDEVIQQLQEVFGPPIEVQQAVQKLMANMPPSIVSHTLQDQRHPTYLKKISHTLQDQKRKPIVIDVTPTQTDKKHKKLKRKINELEAENKALREVILMLTQQKHDEPSNKIAKQDKIINDLNKQVEKLQNELLQVGEQGLTPNSKSTISKLLYALMTEHGYTLDGTTKGNLNDILLNLTHKHKVGIAKETVANWLEYLNDKYYYNQKDK